jgi:hypothetical protein
MLNETAREDLAVAKGQKRSGREPKKLKKTAAERLKSSQATANLQIARISDKNAPKKP